MLKLNKLWCYNKLIYLNEQKENNIVYFYHSPIAAVYNLIAELLCNNEGHIKECKYCGYYMYVENLHQEYHEDCHRIVDSNRKRKNDKY